MFQITPNHGGIEILEGKRRGGLPELIADISTQEFERIAVAGDGVLTDALLGDKVVAKESGNEGCKWCHGLSPCIKPSQSSAILEKSAGVASRYQ
jgi:hypothetical protein